MVKKKGKGVKKPKATTRKRVSSFSDEEVPVVTSLPPAVEGQLRCFLKVSVPKIHWTVPHYPEDVRVRLKWWGEEGAGILFRPLDEGVAVPSKASKKNTSARYPVCSGPKQFAAYLHDMGYLVFEVVHGPSLILLGKAELTNLAQLSANNPIHGYFPVMSVSTPSHQLADLYAAIRFESMSAAYNRLSSSAVPTVDTEWGQHERGGTDVSDVDPTPPPNLIPTTPIVHPSQKTEDLFVSPAPVKGVKFSDVPPEKVVYPSDPALTLLPPNVSQESVSTPGHQEEGRTVSSRPSSEGLQSDTNFSSVSPKTGDLIGALLERGDRLRKAMAVFSLEENELSDADIDRHIPSGRLFKEILTADKLDQSSPGRDPEESIVDNEPLLEVEGKAVDLVLGEEELVYLSDSPHPTPEGSDVSDTGDPLYDESLLRDLFYTTPAVAVESDAETTSSDEEEDDDPVIIVSSDPDTVEGNKRPTRRHFSPKDIPVKRKHKRTELSPRADHERHATKRREKENDAVSQDETADVRATRATRTSPNNSLSASSVSSNFVESLGIETLTALGRINSARVVLENLTLQSPPTEKSSSTYFVEYHFPVATHHAENRCRTDTVMEVTRVASKKVRNGVVLFTHRSAFPVSFDAAVTDQWWRLALTFRVFRRETGQRVPTVLGTATLPLRSVLQSTTLSCSAAVEVKQQKERTSPSSSTSPPSSSLQPSDPDISRHAVERGFVGKLQVKIELLSSDGKEIHLKQNPQRKPPLPHLVSSVTNLPIKSRAPIHQSPPRAEPISSGPQIIHVGAGKSGKPTHTTDTDSPRIHVRDSVTLFTLLWIPEGKGVTLQGSRGNDGGVPGVVARSNLYLVIRMFWCEDTSISTVCWGTSEPQFGFRQVAPVQLTSTLLQRACNNFVVVEVWDKSVHDGDKLIGIVKLPLQQFYLSYRDPKITKTLLKSKYPVVAVDEWKVVTSPFSSSQHGQLKVLLAMGSKEQISSLFSLKTAGDVLAEPHNRMDHHLDVKRGIGEERIAPPNKPGSLVEHQFEVVVEDIRGLSVFGNSVWGETDCFVQYHFPRQRQSDDDEDDEEIPNLKPHRTATTLCVPEPSFHDIARHTFVLRQGVPVQRVLLAAFTGSWVGSAGFPGSGSVPFELWRRYYYPNARDQLVAKANLPLAKLCAMVTMQKSNEPSVQTFSLPITVLPGEDQSARQGHLQDTGLLDVTVRYRQSKESGPSRDEGRAKENHVCIMLELTRACGLKAAALCQSQSFPSMSYPADVGVSCYVVVNVPVGKKRMLVTRTVARTFCPDFSFHAELQVPVISTRKKRDSQHRQEEKLSLAEQLETQEVSFEIWHQVSRGSRDSRHVTSTGQRPRVGDFDDQPDVLLGTVRVPLIKLLTQRTGIKGWHAIHPPSQKTESETATADCDNPNDVCTVVGGLNLHMKFAEPEDRDDVIHTARALGWSPPRGSEIEEDWDGDDEEDQSCVAGGVALRFKVDKVWFPHKCGERGKTERSLLVYARYKFYDKRPVCSRLAKVKVAAAADQAVCELRHSSNLVLPITPSLTWFLREERLEVQLWLGRKARHDKDERQLPRQRDRLVGSAYVDLSSLVLNRSKRIAQISGLFPLFKAGAEDLHGACVRVQIEATQPGAKSNTYIGRQEEAVVDDDDVSSDEYISSELRDESVETRSLASSDRTASKRKTESAKEPKTADTTERNTFPAHVIVERALHLPAVIGTHGERIKPNVYVSYQTTSLARPECTPVVRSCSSPLWEYQKLQRLAYPPDSQPMSLHFKVWHHTGVEQQEAAAAADQQTKLTGAHSPDVLSTDHVIGFASVDLAPLSAGMRQLNGWYNIVDFNGQCKGQLKVGIAPVTPLSPSRCLTRSNLKDISHKERFAQDIRVDNAWPNSPDKVPQTTDHEHGYDTRADREHLADILSGQLDVHLESLKRLRATGVTHQPDESASTETVTHNAWTNSSCSTSLLFGQLRHNMKELDELQQDLQSKLRRLNYDTHATDKSQVLSTSQAEEPSQGTRFRTLSSSASLEADKSSEPVTLNSRPHEAASKMRLQETDRPHGTITTRKEAGSEKLEQNRCTEPGGDEFTQSDLETNLRSVDERSVIREEEVPFRVSEGREPAVSLKDSGVFTREDRFQGREDDVSPREFAPRVNEKTQQERSHHTDEHHTSGEDSDSLEEISYINDNTTEKYTHEKDSWISTDEEETRDHPEGTPPGDGNRTSPSAPDVNEAIQYITSLDPTRHGFSSELDGGKRERGNVLDMVDHLGENGERNAAINDGDFEGLSREENAGPCRTSGSADSEAAVSGPNSCNERNTVHNVQSSVRPALPNFFMPTEQLEQSMRAVRLAASFQSDATGLEDTRPKSKLLSRTGFRKEPGSGTSELAEDFAKRKLVYSARERGDPPISSDEAQRIARIFSSKNSV